MLKDLFFLFLFAILGILLGYYDFAPEFLYGNASTYTLYVMLFLVGIGIGFDIKALYVLKEMKASILLVPFGILAGSLIAGALISFPLGMTVLEGMTVGSAVGYYSLSSILVTEWGNAELGSITLLANLLREFFCIAFPVIFIKIGGKLAPIMVGGAAAMDTCLTPVAKYCGERYALIAIFSGLVLTIVVPILLPFLLSLQTPPL